MTAQDELNIIHGDLDAFFAAVEQRDIPSLRGKAVIIGGDPESRGVVATCSYEARQYGIKSAMPLAQARQLCPGGIFLPVNMKLYKQASRQVMAILASYTPLVEQLSIDEAFLDVSGCTTLFGTAEQIAREIKQRVYQEVGLTISMGISYNKYLAKLATELGKPDGLRIIRRDDIPALLPPLPVSYIWGVGAKTLRILQAMQITTVGELLNTPLPVLEKRLGSQARQFLHLAQGIDSRSVQPQHESKSMGKEITFEMDVDDPDLLENILLDFAGQLARRLRRHKLNAQTVNLKIRYEDFRTLTRSQTISESSNGESVFYHTACEMLHRLDLSGRKIRLIGLNLGKLSPADVCQQGLLFTEEAGLEKKNLDKTLDRIRDRLGEGIIIRASLMGSGNSD